MSRRPTWYAETPFHRELDRVRWLVAQARLPALRGRPYMHLGPAAHVFLAPDAEVSIGGGFRAQGNLRLVVSGHLEVGHGLFMNRGATIECNDRITIGDQVRIGFHTTIVDFSHVIEPLADTDARFLDYETVPVSIGHRVLISANCIVLPGGSIGDDAVIAPNSVVRSAIPAGTLAAGAPAVVRRELER